jgi:hypothetical protein
MFRKFDVLELLCGPGLLMTGRDVICALNTFLVGGLLSDIVGTTKSEFEPAPESAFRVGVCNC